MPGLRERKKERTRRTLADVALRCYERDGFEATTVQAICDEAEVAVSTFYAYFPSKEAVAFPDDDDRVALVAAILRDAPADEPLHVTVRRMSLALAERDMAAPRTFSRRAALAAAEPALAAHAGRRQAEHVERLARLLAERMGIEPADDLRPRFAIGAAFGALNAAWAAWTADPTRDLRALVEQAHDLLDAGLADTRIGDDWSRPPSG